MLCHELSVQGIDVIGPVRDQTGQWCVGPGGHPGPDLGAVVARVARPAQMQETALSIRQGMALGAEAAPVAAEGGIRLFFGARPPRSRVRA